MSRTLFLALSLASVGCVADTSRGPVRDRETVVWEETEDTGVIQDDQWPGDDHQTPDLTPHDSDLPMDTGNEPVDTEEPTTPLFVEIDAYLAFNPSQSPDGEDYGDVGRYDSYSIDQGETYIPSQIVFTFWTETDYVCHVAAFTRNEEAYFDAQAQSWDLGSEGKFTGVSARPYGVLPEWSDCTIDGDGAEWEEWFEEWDQMKFGFEQGGAVEFGGTVDGMISIGDWTYAEDRAGYVYGLDADGFTTQALSTTGLDYTSDRILFVSDGLYMSALN